MDLSQPSNFTSFPSITTMPPLQSANNWHVFSLLSVEIAAVIGNSLVCLSVALEKRLRTITNYILVSLAIADLLVSLVVMPGYIAQEFKGFWPFGLVTCAMWQMTDVIMCTSSIMHMCIISFDRFKCIKDPLSIRERSKGSVAARILAVWIFAICVSSPLAFLAIFRPSDILNSKTLCIIQNNHFLVYGSIAAFFLPLMVMLITYSLTIKLLRKKASEIGGLRRSVSTKKLLPPNRSRLEMRSKTEDSDEGGRLIDGFKSHQKNNLKRYSNAQVYENKNANSSSSVSPSNNKLGSLSKKDLDSNLCYYQIREKANHENKGKSNRNQENKRTGSHKDNSQEVEGLCSPAYPRCVVAHLDHHTTTINSELVEASVFDCKPCVTQVASTSSTPATTTTTTTNSTLPFMSRDSLTNDSKNHNSESNSRESHVATLPNDNARPLSTQVNLITNSALAKNYSIKNLKGTRTSLHDDEKRSQVYLNNISMKEFIPLETTLKTTTTKTTLAKTPTTSHHSTSDGWSLHLKDNNLGFRPMSENTMPNSEVTEDFEKKLENSESNKNDFEKNLNLEKGATKDNKSLLEESLKQPLKTSNKQQLKRQKKVENKEDTHKREINPEAASNKILMAESKQCTGNKGGLRGMLRYQLIKRVFKKHHFKPSLSTATDVSFTEDALNIETEFSQVSKSSSISKKTSLRDVDLSSIRKLDSNFSPEIKVSDFSEPYFPSKNSVLPDFDKIKKVNQDQNASFKNFKSLQTPSSIREEKGLFKQVSLKKCRGAKIFQQNQSSASNSVKNEQKAVKVLGLMFAMFVACWFVFFSVNFTMGVCPGCKIGQSFFKYVLWLGYTSSLINPIIYTVFNLSFRKAFIRILTCQHCLQFCKKKRKNSQMFLKYN